jgi:hypothetical protein
VVARVGERIHRGLEEEEARVLPRPKIDEGDPRRDARDAEPVRGCSDDAGDVRPVPVFVHIGGIRARAVGIVRALSVDLVAERVKGDVGREVSAQGRVEVRRDVRMRAVDVRVEDADQDARIAELDFVRRVGGGVDHFHAPLKTRQRLRVVRRGRSRTRAARALACEVAFLEGELVDRSALPKGLRNVADSPVRRSSEECGLAGRVGDELRVRRPHRCQPDRGILPHDRAPDADDRRAGRLE